MVAELFVKTGPPKMGEFVEYKATLRHYNQL